MSLLPKSNDWCRRYSSKFNSGWDIPLDHVTVLDEQHLRRILRKYVDYYHSCRTHLSLEKDAPEPRRIASPTMGKVRAIPKVGGLHHYYIRRAA